MSYPLVQFVSAPEVDATVLLDLHAEGPGVRMYPRSDGWSLGTPQLEGDPDGIGVSYGMRTLSFTQVIRAHESVARARQSDLARLMLRREGWLRFQLSATAAPVWFHLYRAEPGDLSFDQVQRDSDEDHWAIAMRLPAEAFAYGRRVLLDPVTISNNPAAPSNGVHYVLPEILGDAPAPLRIAVNPSAAADMPGYRWMHSLHAGAAPLTPIVWQIGAADGWTLGNDTGADVASTAFSGGSYRPVTFTTTPGLANRVSGPAPTDLPPGTYKVLARLARNDQSTSFTVRFGQWAGFAYKYGPTATMAWGTATSSGHAAWVDLGEYGFPWGNNAPPGMEGTSFEPNIALQVGRLSGAGQARLDAIMLIPIDLPTTVEARTLFSDFFEFGIATAGGTGYWDGDEEAFWSYGALGNLDVALPRLVGQFPRVVPGAANVLTMLQQVDGVKSFWSNNASDSIALDSLVELSYHPRHLWIGSGTV